jgi:tetratricopeptide (TPR) repeat protein
MKRFYAAFLIALTAMVSVVRAREESFPAYIKQGDALRTEQKLDEAIAAYEKAKSLAANDTEKGIALGKVGVVHANDRRDYAAAKLVSDEALAIADLHPVAKVTNLQVRATVQMRSDEKDLVAAEKTLAEALELKDVDWAKPTMYLQLGDCLRMSNQPDRALETYAKVLELDTADGVKAVAHLNRGLTYQYNLSQNDNAKAEYDQAVKLNPGLGSEIDEHRNKMK